MNRKPISAGVITTLLLTLSYSSLNFAQSRDVLEQQRKRYDDAQALIDRSDINRYISVRPTIQDYPLTPYIDYRVFSLQLPYKTVDEVNQFITQHANFPFSRRIRAPYLDVLASKKDWSSILQFQQTYPVGEKYQCIYHLAQLKSGDEKSAFEGANQLWLSGESIDDACDPLFNAWHKAGLKNDEVIIERMLLVFANNNGRRLSYLAKKVTSTSSSKLAKQIVLLYKQPQLITSFLDGSAAQEVKDSLAHSAFKKYAKKHPEKALTLWPKLSQHPHFPQGQRKELAEYLAMRFITTENEAQAAWRDDVLSKSDSTIYLERRSRLAIQQSDWQGLMTWIARLPQDSQRATRWQYWLARAELKTGNEQGEQRLRAILGKRNFYSVAAAFYLGEEVDYPTTKVTLNSDVVQPYMVDLLRISELLERDKIAAAKSEWRYLLSRTSGEEQTMLAAYASQNKWHHFSVVASIEAKMWDAIELRFPVAHQELFSFYANKLELDDVMLMSLARQESAMDVEARSPVGARGVMQIMPATARYTAKKHKIRYKKASELYEVDKNIEIGSHYLSELLKSYESNRIFAFAAYNAGPNRVKRWRENSQGNLDAIAFIESIPFKETRGYVQNILMFQLYYQGLQQRELDFLTESEANTQY